MQRELHVVSPLMRGPDVLEVQQRLLAAGFEPQAVGKFHNVCLMHTSNFLALILQGILKSKPDNSF